jgi:fermentation-respiration switch protein FrsA (DUF1100 family)
VNVLKSLVIFGIALYLCILALMYFAQRKLMYFPEGFRTSPANAGFPQAEEVTLETRDGERVIAWHAPPLGDKPVLLYFHGNAGAIRYRVDRFRNLTASGMGLVALSYRGYGGSSGSPTEQGLMQDAAAAYEFAVSHYAPERIAVWGESLGTGVAVAIASERAVRCVILEAPYFSAVDIAASAYPFAPVRWLMQDQFRSDLRIGKVTAPVMVVHGDRDAIIPIASAERLFALIKSPRHFTRIEGGGHEDLAAFGAYEAAKKFMEQAD